MQEIPTSASYANIDEFVGQSDALVDRIRPILGGIKPEIVGATLSQCVAIWIASHVITNDDRTEVDIRRTAKLRKDVLDAWVTTTRELVPVMEAGEILPRLFGGRDR